MRIRSRLPVRCLRLYVTGFALVAALSGCSLKPWVAPYERNLLADQVMSFDRDPVAGSYMHHVFQAREGARGAEGGGGGGCGCN